MIRYLRLLRIGQWAKNILIFAPLLFARRFGAEIFALAALAFVSFSLAASAMYILNDILDAPSDRHHPEKRKRPLASGELSLFQALPFAFVLFAIAEYTAFNLGVFFALIVNIYLALNICYSVYLKKLLVVDVVSVAAGFVLRVVAGAAAVEVLVSPWIILVTFFGALFLALGKRKSEIILLADNVKNHRKVLLNYSPDFIDQLLSVSAAMAIISYTLYTVDSETVSRFGGDFLIYTVPFVVIGIFRYFHLLYNKQAGGDPTKIFLTDRGLLLTFLFWLAAIVFILNYAR